MKLNQCIYMYTKDQNDLAPPPPPPSAKERKSLQVTEITYESPKLFCIVFDYWYNKIPDITNKISWSQGPCYIIIEFPLQSYQAWYAAQMVKSHFFLWKNNNNSPCIWTIKKFLISSSTLGGAPLYQVWWKSTQGFLRFRVNEVKIAYLDQVHWPLTLGGSRPKSNQFIYSRWCTPVPSLMKIHPGVLEILR